jgi:hypothetical protein
MVSGRRFVKFKILVPIGEPLHDRIRVELPGIGEIKAYYSYEKVNIICNFCGRLGHEIASCADHVRLTEVLLKPENQGRFNDAELLEPKMGVWMVNSALIPRSKFDGGVGYNKRTLHRRDSVIRIESSTHLAPSSPFVQTDLNHHSDREMEPTQTKRPRPNSPALHK